MEERILYKKCPLCSSARITEHKIGDCSRHPLYRAPLSTKVVWMMCNDCAHVFTEGYFNDAACNIVFGHTNDSQRVGGAIEVNRAISSRMIEKVLPFVSEGIWLDVGFGNGSLLFTAQEYGFKAVGLDLRSQNVDIMNSLGIDAYCATLHDVSLHEKCAVISMADVLEHMPYPKDALHDANRLLQTGGVLLVSMPNSESIVWTILDEDNANPYWGEIEHYHNFSRSTLFGLLRQYGFTPKRYGISERYRVCMEVIAVKEQACGAPAAT
jgi:predicted SAM-dependent methyltransferase